MSEHKWLPDTLVPTGGPWCKHGEPQGRIHLATADYINDLERRLTAAEAERDALYAKHQQAAYDADWWEKDARKHAAERMKLTVERDAARQDAENARNALYGMTKQYDEVHQEAEALRTAAVVLAELVDGRLGKCPLHGTVDQSHRCRDYDGEPYPLAPATVQAVARQRALEAFVKAYDAWKRVAMEENNAERLQAWRQVAVTWAAYAALADGAQE